MSISKEELLKRRDEIVTEYNDLVTDINKGESQVKTMRNNLNALAGALQQINLFIEQIEDDGDAMPPEKVFALDMATSQEKAMAESRIIEEKEESNSMVHETLTTNPNNIDIVELAKAGKLNTEEVYVEVNDEEYEMVLKYRELIRKEKEENEKL